MAAVYFAIWAIVAVQFFLAAGSLLSLSHHPHWFIRGWDFPRLQIVVISWTFAALHCVLDLFETEAEHVAAWFSISIAVALTLWHGFRFIAYTPLVSTQAKTTPKDLQHGRAADDFSIRIVMSNVEMENLHYERWMEVMKAADPDVLLVVETDKKWISSTQRLIDLFPFRVLIPQSNWYGMSLLSKLPIQDHKIRYLVQEDVPSIDARIQLNEDTFIRFIGVHPRPPEPIRGNDATARDAELTLWGKELSEETRPVIIGGDLNDVAWSHTTRLFMRTSKLLDPRRGRGFYNTFSAKSWFWRFPLDHVFHSDHFTVTRLKRLTNVGSDHFPIMIELRYTPSMQHEHEKLSSDAGDEEEVSAKIERAVADPSLRGGAVN